MCICFIPFENIKANSNDDLASQINDKVKAIDDKIGNNKLRINDISYRIHHKRFKFYFDKEVIKKITTIKYTSNERQYKNEYYFDDGFIFAKTSILDFNSEPEYPRFVNRMAKCISRNIYFKKSKIFKVVNSHKAFKNEISYRELEKQIFENLNQFSFLSPKFRILNYKIYEGKGNSYSKLLILCNKKSKIKLKYYLYDRACNITIYSYLGDKLYDLSGSIINKIIKTDLIFNNISHCFLNIETKSSESRWWIKIEFEGEEIKIG